MDRRTFLTLSLLMLLVGAGLRFARLAGRSLWLDEATTANHARGSIVETVTKTRIGNSSPVAYPLILNLVQRIDDSATAVRLPSALCSLGAVAVLLSLAGAGVDRHAALIAGAILAVSPSQVRYAQEVREYALSVLVAALMIWFLARGLGRRNGAGVRVGLALVLFAAPLVQYGLVLLALAILLVWFAAIVQDRGLRTALGWSVIPTGALAAGTVLTLELTLRGQWRHTDVWYLAGSFCEQSLSDPSAAASFLVARIGELLPYLTLGEGAALLALPAIGVLLLLRPGVQPGIRSLLALTPVALAVVGAAALLHSYPLGPIRQDLFLAPTVTVALGLGWGALTAGAGDRVRRRLSVAALLMVVAAGVLGIVRAKPYQELEDIKSVIAGLSDRPEGVPVYVYYGAWQALRFYRVDGPDFVYGGSHRDDPSAYAVELRTLVDAEAPELWLVFSHVFGGEGRRLLDDLAPEWTFERVVDARGACLYRGLRDVVGPVAEEPKSSTGGPRGGAVEQQWNVR